MANIDVFNGDADGICALIQLRLANPLTSELVTGVKRDIELLANMIAGNEDIVTVLDVSMEKNKRDLLRILDAGAEVFYCDHHESGEIPSHSRLKALINLEPNVCTSLLVNGYLQGKFALWAVVGAFGDNLNKSALAVAKPFNLDQSQLDLLENLGIYINYNGYGASLDDLHFHPRDLFVEMQSYASPFDFIEQNASVFQRLQAGYLQDMAKSDAARSLYVEQHAAVYVLPDEKWARRVSGVYSNDLANHFPDRAHAVFTELPEGGYLVSVRAPLSNKQGAVDICRQFPTGGGRAAAAGINVLAEQDVARFIDVFQAYYRS